MKSLLFWYFFFPRSLSPWSLTNMWFDSLIFFIFFLALCTNPWGFATCGVCGGGVSILLLLPLIASDCHPNNQTHINTLLSERLWTLRADGDFKFSCTVLTLRNTQRSVVTEQLRDIPAQMQIKKINLTLNIWVMFRPWPQKNRDWRALCLEHIKNLSVEDKDFLLNFLHGRDCWISVFSLFEMDFVMIRVKVQGDMCYCGVFCCGRY